MPFAAGALGALLPVVIACWAAFAILHDPLWVVALLPLAAALNSVQPIGGGMLVAQSYRIRLFSSGLTVDGRRSALSASLGPFLLAAATVGGFFVAVPILAVAARLLDVPAHASPRAVALAGALVALVVAGLTHRRESPLPSWRLLLLAGGVPDDALGRWVRRLEGLARPDGSIGHVGGVGSDVVGLHEHLDAEQVLREAERRGISGAAALRSRALAALVARELPGGGFPVYPGGLPRDELTRRANEALGR
jgi:hypothetical protein